MGLLDDAIREHLDLKRRHGADPAEVERAEREALGPVRRAPERAAVDDVPADDGAELEDVTAVEGPYDDEPIDFEDDEPEDSRALAPRRAYDHTADLASGHVAPATETGPDSWSHDAAADDLEPGAAVPHHAEPYAAEPPASEPPAPATDPQRHGYADHTAEPEGEEALESGSAWDDEPAAEDPAPEGEDVLEETPEFLQDTPDHDRLWFEQRPPRDFDFDK